VPDKALIVQEIRPQSRCSGGYYCPGGGGNGDGDCGGGGGATGLCGFGLTIGLGGGPAGWRAASTGLGVSVGGGALSKKLCSGISPTLT
jgi:hypothetical protein